MRTRNEKNKFLQELREIPIVSVVCKRTSISKATIYRWRQNDKSFRQRMDDALEAGRETINDLAEGTLIGAIKKGSLRATEYWLENNKDRYYRPKKPKLPESEHRCLTQFIVKTVTKESKGIVVAAETIPPPNNSDVLEG